MALCYIFMIFSPTEIKESILGILTKISLNLNQFPLIPPNFEGNKNLRFWGKREE